MPKGAIIIPSLMAAVSGGAVRGGSSAPLVQPQQVRSSDLRMVPRADPIRSHHKFMCRWCVFAHTVLRSVDHTVLIMLEGICLIVHNHFHVA